MDSVLRLRVTTNINMFFLYQLPMPRLTAGNPYFDRIVPLAAKLVCTRPEFADLWTQVMGEAWAESKAASDPAERARLRAAIDGLVAHLFGLSEADFAHLLEGFPLVGESVKEAALKAYSEIAPGL